MFVTSCTGGVPEFSGTESFKVLMDQCSFGPRNPGSDGHEACRNYLLETFSSFADTVWIQEFTSTDPYTGEEYRHSNIIAQFNTAAEMPHVLLGAHWDTRPWADMEADPALHNSPIIGANDGASGVAVLAELGKLFSNHPPPAKVTVVLFDGEDLGKKGVPESFSRGSKYFAKNLPVDKPVEAIIVDMVGDTMLEIPIERFSYQIHPGLVRKLWKIADNLKLPAFKNELGVSVYDDHIPLWEIAKIPAVDLIDFNYPDPYRNYWHTMNDIPENCSPTSLEQVGKVLARYIYTLKTND